MRKIILVLITQLAVSAHAAKGQEIFMESILWKGSFCTTQTIEDIQQDVEVRARSRCSGKLTRQSDWIQVLDMPVRSFCYPTHLIAVFECLSKTN